MKIVITICSLFVACIVNSSYSQASPALFKQIKIELNNQGVPDDFMKITENSVKKILAQEALPADIQSVLLDLWNDGVKGRALKNALTAVVELVESGDSVLEAAKITSAAAHQAQAQGLSGFGVGMRVKKSVQARKAYLKTLQK